MPKVESANDRSAKQGKIASHRWLGANTAAPLFYDQTKQVELTAAFLKTDVLDVDIFAIKREATNELIAPLSAGNENCFTPLPGEEVVVEVVVSNRNAAHSFPPEVRDLYEAWIEFEVVDAAGKTIFHSGYLQPDGLLDESAHVYKQIILDEQSRPITRHQIWTTNIKAYDNAIPPGRSDIARFRLPSLDGPATLRARVNYRRLNAEYTSYVLARQKRQFTLPIVRMAEVQAFVVPASAGIFSGLPAEAGTTNPNAWKRWNDYGIGLLEQSQYGPAAAAFRRAIELSPADPNLLASAALAEMRTERFGPEREQWRKAAALLDAAMTLDPRNWRTRYFRALVLRGDGKLREAADELQAIAMQYPRDREVQRASGETLYSLGQAMEARSAFEIVTAIDPTDFGAWSFLASVYTALGRKPEADRAQSLYLQWRDDPLAYDIALKFFAAHPQWADERIGPHTHGGHSARRPIALEAEAAPQR